MGHSSSVTKDMEQQHGRRTTNLDGTVREEGEPGGPQGPTTIGLATADALDSFNHDRFLFSKRVGVAMIFVLCLNVITLILLSIPFHTTGFAEYNFLAPIISPYKYLTTLGPFIYLMIGFITIPLIVAVHARQIVWRKPEYSSRVEYGKAILKNWRWVPTAFAQAFCGVLLIKSYLKILDLRFGNFVYTGDECPPEMPEFTYCFDEGHVFILYCVFIISFVYFINFRFTQRFVVRFLTFAYGVDIWYQIKYDTRKHHFGDAVFKTFMCLPFMYAGYLLAGNSIRAAVGWVFDLEYVAGQIDSFWDLINLELFAFTISSCVMILLVFKITWEVLEICITTRIEFPVDVTQPVRGKMLLADALGFGGYVRRLAHFDFMRLSDGEFPRYDQIFRVNERDGSAVTWVALKTKTMNSIREAKERIDAFVTEQKQSLKKSEIAKARAKPRSTLLYSTSVPTQLEETDDAKTLRQRNIIYKKRDLSEIPNEDGGKGDVEVIRKYYTPRLPTWTVVRAYIVSMFRKSKYGIYFFDTTLDSRISALLADTQFILWDVHSIVNICIDAFRGTRGPILQKGLAEIIYLLIDYYETILEFRTITKRIPTEEDGPWSSSMMEQEHLHDALKFAVSQLAYNFRYCLDLLQLNPLYLEKLREMDKKQLIPGWVLEVEQQPQISPGHYLFQDARGDAHSME